MKKSIIAVSLTMALALVLAACGDSSNSTSKTYTPTYVVGVDAIAGNNVEIFSINQSSNALNAINGSPYSFGLTEPDGSIVTHPNGKWVYICDWQSSNLVALSIDQNAGTPTQINSTTDSGACFWTGSLTITPAGKYVYTADNNLNTTAFSVDSTAGGLTKIGSVPTANAGQTMFVVTATDNYVYAADHNNDVYIMKIGSDGSLGAPTAFTISGASHIESLQVDRSGKFLYVSGLNATAAAYGFFGFSIASDGSLTSVGSPVTPASLQSVGQMVFSGDNKFMYAADSLAGVRGFSFNSSSGVITELAGSPFYTTNKQSNSVALDPTGKFLFADDYCTSIYSWARDSATGELSNGTLNATAGKNICQLTVMFK